MDTITDKLNYLSETKDLFKNRLVSLGAEITNQTTFRNYLNWVKNLYSEVSNKTRLAREGIEGNTYQETTTGKNLFDKDNANTINLYINNSNSKLVRTNEGTGCFYIPCEANTTYTVSKTELFGNDRFCVFDTARVPTAGDTVLSFVGSRTGVDTHTSYTITTTATATYLGVFVKAGTNPNKTMQEIAKTIQIEKNSSATSYEKYTGGNPAPNPDYPQEIVNISGKSTLKDVGKNLLPYPYTITTSPYTNNGITYTINNDGTINVNGTATGRSSIALYGSYLEVNNKLLTGRYIKGGTNNVNMYVFSNGGGRYPILAQDTGQGAEIDTSTYKKGYIELVITQGTTVNNELIKPMMLNSLDDTTYEPYKEQIFDLDLKSKNLYYIKPQTINGVTLSYDEDGAIVLNGTTTGSFTALKQDVSLNGTFTLSTNNAITQANVFVRTRDLNGILLHSIPLDSTSGSVTKTGGISKFEITIGSAGIVFDNFKIYAQLEENSTATKFEPYYDINLCKIDTYKNRIYPLNGKWYLEKKIGKVVFDNNDYLSFAINAVASTFVQLLTPVIDNLFSTTTPTIDNQKLLSNYISNFGGVTANSRIRINILHQNLGTNSSSTNAEAKSAFVNKMTGKTLIFYYVLATPTTEEITENNYPTLYNQLNSIQDYLIKYKINKEFMLEYSEPTIEIESEEN